MATFFEGFQFMSNFSGIFTFLFMYALVYGLLSVTKPFGDDKKNLHAIIAFTGSLLVLFSRTVTNLISFMAPWFILAVIVIFFFLFILMLFGLNMSDFKNFMQNSPERRSVVIWSIALMVILLAIGLSQELGQAAGPYLAESNDTGSQTQIELGGKEVTVGKTNTGSFEQNLGATIFHPKVLGMIVLIVIASFAVRLLSQES